MLNPTAYTSAELPQSYREDGAKKRRQEERREEKRREETAKSARETAGAKKTERYFEKDFTPGR